MREVNAHSSGRTGGGRPFDEKLARKGTGMPVLGRLIGAAAIAAVVSLLPVGVMAEKVPQKSPQKDASKSGETFNSPDSIQKWINGYRARPEPARLPAAITAMSQLGVIRDIDSAGLYIGFAAGVLGANPQRAEKLVAAMFPLPPEDQVAVVRAIAWSGLPEWKDLLGRFAERMPARRVLIDRHLSGKLATLMTLPLDESPAGIDALWGNYYATGAPEPIWRIISALAWTEDKNNLDKLTAGNMAKLTLAINASRDVDLMFILKRELVYQKKDTAKPLADVIEAAETFETARIRKQALAAIELLKQKGPADARNMSWWGQAGQTALALGCVAASAMGQVQVGIPCVVGGAASSAALKLFTPGQ